VIRATADPGAGKPADASPLAWNRTADSFSLGLRRDLHLHVALNRALNDVAISVWGAKRTYQSPRPISMIRYLAFEGQLPLVPGLIELRDGQVSVLSQGRWVPGARWTPPAATPASPGWVSERSAFAAAAVRVLGALTGRSFDRQAERLGSAGVAAGIETPADETAGSKLGSAVAQRALRR